jgi:hypothetical protein
MGEGGGDGTQREGSRRLRGEEGGWQNLEWEEEEEKMGRRGRVADG